MSKTVFIINAPSFSFDKPDLYSTEFSHNKLNQYIKAIADSFFLSNHFRKNNLVYYCTDFGGESYQITFKGDELRFLGPSFFSAGHLLLRAKNHIINPDSKKGKLTPGISVHRRKMEWVFDKYRNERCFQIIASKTISKNISLNMSSNSNVFFYGFENLSELENKITKRSLGPLDIDEQIIMTNFMIESVK